MDDSIRADTMFIPFHWGGVSSANLLTDTALDPHSKMPAFKVCAANATRVGGVDDDHLLTAPAVRPSHAAARPADQAGVTTTETRRRPPTHHRKDVFMASQNRFLQGIYPFTGSGVDKPAPLAADLVRLVPDGVVAQALYFRGGNTSDELVTVVLMRDGVPMRYFPIGARSDVHVPLRVVEDLEGGSAVELYLAAPQGLTGHVVVDLGMVEV